MQKIIVDLEAVKEAAMKDSSVLHMHIKSFVDYSSNHIEVMKQAFDHDNDRELENTIQELKPHIEAVGGMDSLLDQINDIEQMLAKPYFDRNNLEDKLSDFISDCKTAIAELRRLVKD